MRIALPTDERTRFIREQNVRAVLAVEGKTVAEIERALEMAGDLMASADYVSLVRKHCPQGTRN